MGDAPDSKPESIPEFDRVMRGLVHVDRNELEQSDRERAKAIIREIIRLSGGRVHGKTRLYKIFYLAHLFYAKSEPDYLSDWPVVKMPHGPGIDSGDSLLDELVRDGSIEIREIEIGPYPATEFRIKHDELPKRLSLAAIDAIRDAVKFANGKSASELSQLTHDYSHSWREAQDGEELDFYIDLLTADEYHERKASMKKTADAFRKVW